jgi:uncharacterized protein
MDIASSLNQEASYWINKLNLKEHPEGGYFVETYKSEKFVNLPEYDGPVGLVLQFIIC